MKAQYIPSKDELILKIKPVRGKANKKSGPFELWWDNEGNIRAIAITNYTEELEKFRGNLNQIIGLQKTRSNKDLIMNFAGCWKDMPEDIFNDFLNEVNQRRKEAFSRRRSNEAHTG